MRVLRRIPAVTRKTETHTPWEFSRISFDPAAAGSLGLMESRKKLLPINSLGVLLIQVDWECSVGVWLR
jgi:hypothetical protein